MWTDEQAESAYIASCIDTTSVEYILLFDCGCVEWTTGVREELSYPLLHIATGINGNLDTWHCPTPCAECAVSTDTKQFVTDFETEIPF